MVNRIARVSTLYAARPAAEPLADRIARERSRWTPEQRKLRRLMSLVRQASLNQTLPTSHGPVER